MTYNNPGCKACQKNPQDILDGNLTKEEFQNCGYVIDFVEWLVNKNICNTSLNGHLKPLHEWACEYEYPEFQNFPKRNWCEDLVYTVGIKKNLTCAVAKSNEMEALRQCLKILKWGFFIAEDIYNVIPQNWGKQKNLVEILKRLASNHMVEHGQESLVKTLDKMNEDIGVLLSGEKKILEIISDYTPANNHMNNYTPNVYLAKHINKFYPYYMNAAITKIFAFLNCDGFIIYDSRVGAALGELIRIWANEYFKQSKAEIPDILRFYIPGDNTCNNRKPTGHIYCVDWKETHKEHYIANIKASWLVEMIRDRVFDTFYLPCDCEEVEEICCLGDANTGCNCQNSTSGNASSYKKCQDVKFHQYIQTRAIESAFFVLGDNINGLDVR